MVWVCCSMGDKCTNYILCLFTRCFPCIPYPALGARTEIETGVAVQELSGEEIPSSLGLQILTFLGLFNPTPLDPTRQPHLTMSRKCGIRYWLSRRATVRDRRVSPHGIAAVASPAVDSSSVRSQSDQSPSIFKIDSLWSDSASVYCWAPAPALVVSIQSRQ